MRQRGFAPILIVIIVLLVGVGALFVLRSPNVATVPNQNLSPENNQIAINPNSDEPPLKLKSIGVEFSDFKFTKERLQFGKPFMEYGFFIPGSDATHPPKYNPQPTFVLPLGTPVRSLVDGVVANVATVWSGDYSIQITADGKMQKWIYEVEHVIKPTVKTGDKVTAGQIIAEVSDFDKGAPEGYGAVEIGILKGGATPQHVCPFAYLDDSIKEETLGKISELFKSWQEYIGDQTLYKTTTVVGCLTLDPIEG